MVTTAGIPAMVKGSTNMIKVEVLGHVFLRGTGVGPMRKVTGKVCLIHHAEEAQICLEKGDILVVKRLDDSYVSIAKTGRRHHLPGGRRRFIRRVFLREIRDTGNPGCAKRPGCVLPGADPHNRA